MEMAVAKAREEQGHIPTLQERVQPWMMATFGPVIAADRIERNHRFIEEALELIQACGCTQSEAHQLVDYVYDRPQGDVNQEVGGVMITGRSVPRQRLRYARRGRSRTDPHMGQHREDKSKAGGQTTALASPRPISRAVSRRGREQERLNLFYGIISLVALFADWI